MSWSEHIQGAEYLEATRIFMLNPIHRDMLVMALELKEGMKVLDIGCGTGAFTEFIAQGSKNIDFTGLDLDQNLIDHVSKKANTLSNGSTLTFFQGDAFRLPFEDNSFDVVMSYTLFINLKDSKGVLNEMKRVVKSEGLIASGSTMSLLPQTFNKGQYPEGDKEWANKLLKTQERFYSLYKKHWKNEQWTKGLGASQMPRFFVEEGLKDIKAYPFGYVYSLSNNIYSEEEREKYIHSYYKGELTRIENFEKIESFMEKTSIDEINIYKELLVKQRDFWLVNIKDNSIWDFNGGGSLLVTARY
jgi:ubiquinone/menaquinone biosynthesis C-methylase UbiE